MADLSDDDRMMLLARETEKLFPGNEYAVGIVVINLDKYPNMLVTSNRPDDFATRTIFEMAQTAEYNDFIDFHSKEQ